MVLIISPLRALYRGTTPCAFEKVPVGPSSGSSARRMISATPSGMDCVPRSSQANCTVSILRAAFDAAQPRYFAETWVLARGRAFVNDPSPLDTFTILADEALRNNGSIACVTATVPRTFTRKVRSIASRLLLEDRPFERGCRHLPECLIARTHRTEQPDSARLAGDFEAGAFVCPGDESDFFQGVFPVHLLPAAGTASVPASK